MSRCMLIVGLPGSGKTRLAENLREEDAVVFDDPMVTGDYGQVREALDAGNLVIVTDPTLCREQTREATKRILAGHDLCWVFFENDPDQCLLNAERRNDGRLVKDTIQSMSKIYTIPKQGDEYPAMLVMDVYRTWH